MKNITTIRKEVMLIANKLHGEGIERPDAMREAWAIVKKGEVSTKVRGVTFGKRQKALEHLKRYSQSDISIDLERDYNIFDSNAVAVMAVVKDRPAS